MSLETFMIDTRTSPYAALVLRVALGVLFLAHGGLKLRRSRAKVQGFRRLGGRIGTDAAQPPIHAFVL